MPLFFVTAGEFDAQCGPRLVTLVKDMLTGGIPLLVVETAPLLKGGITLPPPLPTTVTPLLVVATAPR